MASTLSISSFYLVSPEGAVSQDAGTRTFLYLPFLMALGIGLTITNTKAVMEALFGKQSAFARTPKYRVQTRRTRRSSAKKYRKRLGWIPWIELLIGSYFALTVWYAVDNENYFTVPFLVLFVFGYWYTGLMSLLQGRFERFFGRDAREPQTAKPYPVGI